MWKRKSNESDTDNSQANTRSQASSQILPAGQPAPPFSLPDEQGRIRQLAEFRGQPVILAFYPGDWSPVCSDQLALYNEVLDMFAEYRAQLIGISVDSMWSHRVFAEQRGFEFPLLTDFEPKGAVARQYGVYDSENGTSQRALFVIDGQGVVYWSYLAPEGVNPGADGILRALDALKTEAA